MAMKRMMKKLASLVLALAMVLSLTPLRGQAVLDGVYFTAVNERLLEMDASTMPFWSREDILYVPVTMFQGTDLGVFYVYNNSMQMAVLYTTKTDLRFSLADQTCVSKEGREYDGFAIEKGGQIFVPIDLVAYHFGLDYNCTETELVPLIRVTSASAMLDDISFIDAASGQLRDRYTRYEIKHQEQVKPVQPDPPPVVVAGQKLHLLLPGGEMEAVSERLAVLRSYEAQATVLLTAEEMENGDLLRSLIAEGHMIALLAQGTGEDEVEAEVERARHLLWQAGRSWLQLVWYESEEDLTALLQDLGCLRLQADLDQRSLTLEDTEQLRTMLGAIQRGGDGLRVCLSAEACAGERLTALLKELAKDECKVCVSRISG